MLIHGFESNALYHFEHLGTDKEEKWAKLLIDDSVSKGIMMRVK
jgi:hypothetical protein